MLMTPDSKVKSGEDKRRPLTTRVRWDIHGRYHVIYADPPWRYKNERTGGSMKSGAASKYPVLSVDEIASLPVGELAERNSVLFLWATVPMLPEGLRVMETWGFKYKTMITWQKLSWGMGFWFRGATEHLLVGIRGRVRAFRLQEPNIIAAKPLAHSEKPEEFRKLVERATDRVFHAPRRIELFARKRVPGWDAWGNEIDEG